MFNFDVDSFLEVNPDANFKDFLVNLRNEINKRIDVLDKAEKSLSTNKYEILVGIFRKLFDSSRESKTAISYQELMKLIAIFSKEKFDKELIESVLGEFGIKTREKNGRTTRVSYDDCRIYGYAIPKIKLQYNCVYSIKELINGINSRVIKTHPPLKSLHLSTIEKVQILSTVNKSKILKLGGRLFYIDDRNIKKRVVKNNNEYIVLENGTKLKYKVN